MEEQRNLHSLAPLRSQTAGENQPVRAEGECDVCGYFLSIEEILGSVSERDMVGIKQSLEPSYGTARFGLNVALEAVAKDLRNSLKMPWIHLTTVWVGGGRVQHFLAVNRKAGGRPHGSPSQLDALKALDGVKGDLVYRWSSKQGEPEHLKNNICFRQREQAIQISMGIVGRPLSPSRFDEEETDELEQRIVEDQLNLIDEIMVRFYRLPLRSCVEANICLFSG